MRLFRAVGRWLFEVAEGAATVEDRLAWMTADSDRACADMRRTIAAIDSVNHRADRPVRAR